MASKGNILRDLETTFKQIAELISQSSPSIPSSSRPPTQAGNSRLAVTQSAEGPPIQSNPNGKPSEREEDPGLLYMACVIYKKNFIACVQRANKPTKTQ
jgi:hypothetical protein